MEHENSDIESDDDDDIEDKVSDEKVVQSSEAGVDRSEPDWRQFAATYGGFQLDTTQESLTSNLFTAVKAEKEYVSLLVIFLAKHCELRIKHEA